MGTQNRAFIDQLLTQHSNGLFNDDMGFIAEQILPMVAVRETTGLVPAYGTSHLRLVNTVHVGVGKYARVDTQVLSSSTYEIIDHGLVEVLTDNVRRNTPTPFDAEIDITTALTSMQHLGKEKALADLLFSTATVTQNTTLTGNNRYNNRSHADSTPIEDRDVAFAAVEDAEGVTPNVAVMNRKTARALRTHQQLLDSLGFKSARPNGLSMTELANALDVDRVLIGDAKYESAAEGQTSSLANVWGNDLAYVYVAPNLGLRQKTFGIEIRKSGTTPREVRKWTLNEPKDAMAINVLDNYDQNILNVNCAYLIKDAIA